jgi:pimeloyl-ACP methyl ester carboxylesterase
MSFAWELVEAGPSDADRTVLLLPGGFLRARSFQEVMSEATLDGIRLVAATLPGHGGTTPPDDLSIEYAAKLAASLASDIHCEAVVGFSMGANVALEMVTSGQFSGPVVLLGIALSLADEAAFLRVLDKLTAVSGSLPFSAMRQMMGSMSKQLRVSDIRRAEMRDDMRANEPKVMRAIVRKYLEYLARDDAPAKRLVDAGVPSWVVHTEKGDGGLTADERTTLEASSNVQVVTIPGKSFLIPSEEPQRVAELVLAALAPAV